MNSYIVASAICFFAFVSVVSSSDLKCYQCDSINDSKCTVHDYTRTTLKECNTAHMKTLKDEVYLLESDSKMTTAQKDMAKEWSKLLDMTGTPLKCVRTISSDKKYVIRYCGFCNSTATTSDIECCDEDGCNGAASLASKLWMVILSSMIVFFYNKM